VACFGEDSVVTGSSFEAGANQPTIEDALANLERALEIVDSLDLPPQIGARIQHAIDTLVEED
jgi:hypothetical protein